MQTGLRRNVQKLNITPANLIEKFAGITMGIVSGIYCFKHFDGYKFISEKEFFDKLLTVCTTLFGFLLTALTLIIQSESGLISEMKKNSSFKRLVDLNKSVILLSALVGTASLFSIFIRTNLDASHPQILTILSCINFGAFTWLIVNTFLFVRIFYMLISIVNKTNK